MSLSKEAEIIDVDFVPEWNYVLVRKDPEAETHGELGLIVVPDVAKTPICCGTVIAKGPGHHNEHGYWIANELEVGDRVVFSPWGGFELKASVTVKENDEVREDEATLHVFQDSDIFMVAPPDLKIEFSRHGRS